MFQSTPLPEESGDKETHNNHDNAKKFQSTPLPEESGDLDVL